MTALSVRELLVELSQLEDNLRKARCVETNDVPGDPGNETSRLMRREQMIVRELQRRRNRTRQAGIGIWCR